MPFNTTKPIVAMIGSNSLREGIVFDRFVDAQHCGAILTSDNGMIEYYAACWAENHNIENIVYKINNLGYNDNVVLNCYKDMVDAADIVIVFWDDCNDNVRKCIMYCNEIERKYICHIVKEK